MLYVHALPQTCIVCQITHENVLTISSYLLQVQIAVTRVVILQHHLLSPLHVHGSRLSPEQVCLQRFCLQRLNPQGDLAILELLLL